MEMEKEFLSKIQKIYGKENRTVIEKAFKFAEKKHKGQLRDSGEEFIVHPYNVAKILVGMQADVDSVVSGMLHDVLENTKTDESEILSAFGSEVHKLCVGASKVELIKKARRVNPEENENLRKMFLTLAGDARVAFIKLADRLHNMQTLEHKEPSDRLKVAQETLDIYVPISERLGMNGLKHTLEDLCFKYIWPEEYVETTNFLNEYYNRSKSIIAEIRSRIEKLAQENGIKATLQSRVKSAYGVFKKTQLKGRENIFDIIAHRIIVKDVKDCYAMLGAVNNLWKPLEGRIKDYIANPKKNLYKSLHTTVMYKTKKENIPFEIQIRTEDMHIFCEYGMAAHWMYKEHGSQATTMSGNSALYQKKKQLASSGKSLIESETDEFLEILKTGFYPKKIFVFTPSLNVIELPEGAITLDFAYYIHTNLGNRCVGAKVNGVMVPITTVLKTADTVEILTSSSKTPSRDWMKICKSHSAISKIRTYFKKEHREENIKIGKAILEEYAKRKGYTLSKLLEDKETLNETLERKQVSSIEDIYATVGYGGMTATVALAGFILKQKSLKKREKVSEVIERANKVDSGILIDGHSDLLKNLAKCCNPIPGDDIVAYVSKGRGIIIHKADCENIEDLQKERFIDAKWHIAHGDDFKFPATVQVFAKNKNSVYTDITNALGAIGVKVNSLNSMQTKDDELLLYIGVMIKDKDELQQVKNKLGSLSLVYEVL